MKQIGRFLIAITVSIFLISGLTAQKDCNSNEEEIAITGKVVDDFNRPVKGATVQLECCTPVCPDIPYPQTTTDEKGEYRFKKEEISSNDMNYAITAAKVQEQGCEQLSYNSNRAPITAPTIHFGKSEEYCNCPISDAKVKNNVEQLTHTLDKLEKIRGVSFTWNEQAKQFGQTQGKKEIGLIAQEVEAVFPELVGPAKEQGYQSVDYDKMTAVLIEAVKELRAENKELKERVEQLERSSNNEKK